MIKEILLEKIEKGGARAGVIGLGYVGLPLLSCILQSGFSATGFDIDPEKVRSLNQATPYLKNIDISAITKGLKQNRVIITSDFDLLTDVDIICICVPTPLNHRQEPDMTYVEQTMQAILARLRKGQAVTLQSTTYPGTTEELCLGILSQSGLEVGCDYFLGFSPEREDPGNKSFSTSNIPRIISGVTNNCLEVIESFYRRIVSSVVPVSSPRTAEMAKLLENIYRSVNIALVNEMKLICDRMGVDIWEVIEAASSKPFGFTPFYPGPGWGGHCIPIDPFYLSWAAKEYGVQTRFIELAGEVNTSMPLFVFEKVMRALNISGKSLKGSRLLIIGIAYKRDIDDMRESPALRIISLLQEYGCKVDYHDDYLPVMPKLRDFDLKMRSVELSVESLRQYDGVVITTDHTYIDYQKVVDNARFVVDTRNACRNCQDPMGKVIKA